MLTPRAIHNYEQIVSYLVRNWGITAANNFIDRFREVIEILSENSEIFPFEDNVKRVQKCILTKHNILYFKETNVIRIISIFDTRQNPKKLLSII